MSRFDYVKYDEEHTEMQKHVKEYVILLEGQIDLLGESRATALALTKLEECYMWMGKAIRDKQIAATSAKNEPEIF